MTEEAAEPESGEKESIPGSGEGAQESDGEKNAVDPAVKKTEDTEEPGEMKKPVENPAEEGQDDVSGQESAAAEEGAGNTSSNDVQSDKPTAPQKVVRAVSAAVQEEEITPVTGEGWVIDSAGKLTIESEAGMKHWREYTEGLTNPHKNNVKAVEFNAAVTYLEDNVFNGCKNLTSITIPESVKSIEDGAFYACRSLENITIPEGVTSIGAAAFQECEKLTSIAIPNSVTNISPSTFQSCTSLTSIAIPDSVTDIWDLAFYECISLKNITIPKNAKSIKMGAFSACSGLTEITIPDSMTSIGVAAFRECSNLESVIMEGSKPPVLEEMEGITAQFTGCKFQKEGTKGIKVPTGTATTYKAEWEEWAEFITDGTDDTEDDLIVSGKGWRIDSTGKLTIDSDAGMDDWSQNGSPSHADNINSVEMNTDGSVTRIGKYAFYRSKITSIIIPDSVISIGGNAFGKCSNLTSITIPDSVTTIGGYLFVECSSLNEVTLPSGMTSIASGMFKNCNLLKGITIPESVTEIEDEAFQSCTGLTAITIPESVTSIGGSAFYGCSKLSGITIPSSVEIIQSRAFQNCSSLETVTMKGDTPPTLAASGSGNTAHFEGCKFVTENAKGIKVPAGTANAYKAEWEEWAEFITDGTDDTEDDLIVSGKGWRIDSTGKLTIESAEGMTNWVNEGRGDHKKDVISAEIEMNNANPITTIGSYAFADCSQLASITIADSVESIGTWAFNKCTSLNDVKLSNQLQSIGEYTFSECGALEEITIPDNVTSIGGWAFEKCSSLTAITIPDSVTTMGIRLFFNCTSLRDVTLPSGMESIQNEMFSGCSQLAGIIIPDGVTSIGAWAFRECGLEGITFPSGVTEIKYGAFRDCKALTAITIPANVTSIGHWAFDGCSSLETVTMKGDTPPTLAASGSGNTAHFTGCKFVTDNTEGIKVPAGTANAYKKAWSEWENYIAGGSEPDTPSDKEKLDAAKKAVEEALADITVSNATTKESLETAIREAVETALEEAGIDSKDITVSVENFAKTEATTDSEGSISAAIKITSGTETASVSVNKPIQKLPGTPADQVAAVKKAVEEALQNAIDKALADTEVTNDNAEEIAAQIAGLIPDAVAEALEAAGVGVDAVGIGEVDIQIEQASADKEGSIKVTIPVTSKEDAGLSESASVQVPVKRPGGEEDPDKEAEEAKNAVEDALKNITITNETTPEDILAALKEKLGDKASVEDIEKFDKTDATEEAPGKISLSIRIIINGKTVIVNVDVSIAQLTRKTGVYVRFTDAYKMDGTTPVYKYTGLAVKPAVEVYNNETILTLGKDYTIGYKNNTKPGTAAALTVKGKGSFSGTSNAVNFKIINADIDWDTDHPTEMTVVVKTKVSPVIMNGTKKLTTKDYELEGEGLANGKYAAATAEGETKTLTVKGKGNYEGSSFEIKVKVIEKSAAGKLSIKIDKNFKPVYDGTALNLSSLFQQPQDGEGADTAADPQEPAAGVITVTDAKDKTKILKEGIDFTVVCTSNLTNAGTVKFTLTGMGAYTGSVSKSFKISPHKVTDNSRFSVTFDEEKTYEYRAAGTEVDNLVVKYLGETDADTDDKTLIPGVDYKVTYSRNKKVSGTKDAELKVTFLNNYKGSRAVQKTFKIAPAKLSSANAAVTVPDKVYSKANRAYKSVPIVTVDGATIKASNYTVSYAWATASQAADDTKYVEDNKVKITIAEGDSWAKVRVTVTPKATGSYGLAEGAVLKGEYYVRKADSAVNLTKAKVTFFNKEGTRLKSLEYNGNTFYTPQGNNAEADNAPDDPNAVYVRVEVSNTVVDPALYDVIWTNARAKGKATVVIRGTGTATDKGMAVGSKNQSVTVKAMALKGKTLKSYVDGVADMMNSFKNLFFRKQ